MPLYSARDSVVATCRMRLEDGRIFIVLKSIEHDEAPLDPAYVRADVVGIGIFLTPLTENSTPSLVYFKHEPPRLDNQKLCERTKVATVRAHACADKRNFKPK